MAGYADLVRSLVSIADSMTATLQAPVTHHSYASATKDASGKVTWGTGTPRQALVEMRDRLIRNAQGNMVLSVAKVTFLRPVAIDPRDKFVLPDGRTAFIVSTNGGLVDPDTSPKEEYLTEVELG